MRPLVALATLALVAACGSAGPATSPDPADAGSGGGSGTASAAGSLPACPAVQSREEVAAGGLPAVTLDCLGGGPSVRLSDLRGPLVVNVWAQWCPPCRDEAPYLAEVSRRAAGRVQFLGIDYLDPRVDAAITFAVVHDLSFPHVRDPDKQTQRALRIAGPPVTVFVDETGRIVHRHVGPFRSADELAGLVAGKLGVRL